MKTLLIFISMFFYLFNGSDILFNGSDGHKLNAQSLKDITIQITDDDAQWPPFTYYHENNTNELTGFAIDVVHMILDKNNISFNINLTPWSRALKSVKEADPYHMLLNASFNEERDKDYFMSQAYYSLNYAFFYSKNKYPQGLKVQSVEEIKKNYKICGLMGYSYEDVGLKSSEVDNVSIHSYDKLVKLLHFRHERCDVFVEGYEIFAGFSAIGKDYLANKNLQYFIIPNIEKQPFHMMISRNFKYGKELQEVINKGITQLKESGKLKELLKKYNLIY